MRTSLEWFLEKRRGYRNASPPMYFFSGSAVRARKSILAAGADDDVLQSAREFFRYLERDFLGLRFLFWCVLVTHGCMWCYSGKLESHSSFVFSGRKWMMVEMG